MLHSNHSGAETNETRISDTMKCIIPGRGVKLFGRSIHCLSRIGEELFFEALKDGLALRTVNSSRSAYACFVFSKMFFFEYDQGCDNINSSNPAELLKCKLTVKSCLAIFKSLATIEKTVEQCKIVFRPDECRLIFTLYCKHGITKTHNLTYQECESLQAVFSKELCPNRIVAQSKVLQDTVANFPNSCEEISFSVCPQSVKITNYVGDEPDPTKVVHTEMTLVPEEFDDFQIGIDTQVTFCLKELRAILSFSEFVNQPISLHFEHAGKPIVFSLDSDTLYMGDFVMATLSENDAPTQQTVNSTMTTNKQTTKEKYLSQRKKTTNMNGSHNSQRQDVQHTSSKSPEQAVPDDQDIIASKSKRIRVNSNEQPSADDFFSDSFPYKEILENHDKAVSKSQQSIKATSIPSTNLNSSILRNTNLPTVSESAVNLSLHRDNDDEVLLSTPPTQKMYTSIFFGDDSQNVEKQKSKNVVLLAADTDDEDD